jgi:hypothetical protein
MTMTNQSRAWFVAFDGIPTRFSTEDLSSFGLSGTYHAALLDVPSSVSEQLDTVTRVVKPGGTGLRIALDDTTRPIFSRKGGEQYEWTTEASATETSLTLGGGTGVLDGATVYWDRETVTLSYVSAGVYTVTRGAFDSEAVPHALGSVISTRPRHWRRRGVRLYEVDTTESAPTPRLVWAGVISGNLRATDNAIEMQCVGRMSLLRRRVMLGWQDVVPEGPAEKLDGESAFAITSPASFGGLRFTVPDAYELADGGFVRIDYSDKRGDKRTTFCRVRSGELNDANGVLDIAWRFDVVAGDSVPLIANAGSFDESSEITLRQAEVLNERPGDLALMLMLSRKGDGANHATYDVLPGRSVDDGSGNVTRPEKRCGAGIRADWVNVASWQALNAGPKISLILEEERDLFDVLANDILWRCGAIAYIDDDGKLAAKRVLPVGVAGSLPAITDPLVSAWSVEDAESDIPGSAKVHCNWNPVTRTFQREITVVFGDVHALYDDEKPGLEYESRSLHVGNAPPDGTRHTVESAETVIAMLDRQYARKILGGVRLALLLPWSEVETFTVGDRFALTLPYPHNFEGGAGFTTEPFEIVGRQLNFDDGTIVITCEQTGTCRLIAPSFLLTSFASTTATVNTSTVATPYGGDLGTDCDEHIPRGASVRVYDEDHTETFGRSEVEIVTGITDTTTILVAAPGTFTATTGDLIVIEDSSETATAQNGAATSDYAFMGDNQDEIGAGGYLRPADRYG